jgi:hypothetical protein
MQITEKQPTARVFVLEVSEVELQQIARGLYLDTTKTGVDPDGDDNNAAFGNIRRFMDDNAVPEL